MTTARSLDGLTAERFAELERRVAALEAIMVPPLVDAGEDGAPRRWLRLAEAAAVSGYSVNGLRKLVKGGKVQARFKGPHLIVKVETIPVRKIG